jgi:Kelch motif/Galactose oxidase, central domain
LILAVLLIAAASMLGYIAAVAANPVGALPDAKGHSAGELDIKPDNHNFGAVELTHQSVPQTIKATNKSRSTSVVFSSVVASPPFLIQSNGCTGALSAGHFCEVEVLFQPNSLGPVKDKAGLTFSDSARNSPQHIALKGLGIPPSPTATVTMTPTMTLTPSPSPTPTMATRTATCTTQATPSIVGLALIAGGQGSDGTPLNTAEVFNPVTNTFTLTTAPALGGNNMIDGRYSHAATATSITAAFASVIVTGGIDANGATNSIETFSSNTNQFFANGTMSDSREGHTATFLVLPAGQLLVTGGRDANGTVLKSAEIYTLTFGGAALSTMNTPRVNAAESSVQVYSHLGCPPAAPVLITGGSDGVNALQTAEVFDPATNTFTLTDQLGGSQMNAPRVFHTATVGGAILIAGGLGAAGVAQASAEVFDFASNKFTLTTDLGGTNMTVARAMHTATGIGGPYQRCCPNQILIAGGIDSSGHALASAEVFVPGTNTFTAVGSMHSARFDHAAASLSNGKVLITGGEDGSGNTLNTAEIYDPTTQTFTLTTDPSLGGNNMNVARKLHTATAY